MFCIEDSLRGQWSQFLATDPDARVRFSALPDFLRNVLYRRQPPWPSGHSSWLQIQMSGFDSLPYQIFWEIVGLERDPLSRVSIAEELIKSSDFGLENREYGRRDPSGWPHGTLYLQKVGTNFSDKWWLLGRYSSLMDSGHRVMFYIEYETNTAINILSVFDRFFVSRFGTHIYCSKEYILIAYESTVWPRLLRIWNREV
jgi:hypothetical protein